MQPITEKFHQNHLKNVGGVAETRTSVYKMAKTDKAPNSGKKQSSMISVLNDPFQVMGTLSGRFH